jgi:hypothetical protein
MNPCIKYQETLWLDLYGELAEGERPAWEKHLETCPGCREEKDALFRVLHKAKDTLIVPLPSPTPLAQVMAAGDRKAERKAESAWWANLLAGVPARPLPALATVLVLVVAVSWFGVTRWESHPVSSPSANLVAGKPLTPEEFAVIKNLRILKEMETIEKLVQVLDKPQTMEPSASGGETIHERKDRTENT